MKQEIALGILKAGRNVFLTGSAGTGKTYLVNEYITYLKERGIEPAIVAPTGIAASHIGGMTIHSFFGLGLQEEINDDYIGDLFYRKFLQNRLKDLQVLIVDEVSMVSPALFESVDKILKAFKHSQEPFGGVQIILSGDFFQLPPISSSGQEIRFAWQTELWKNSNLRVCYLEEKFRQEESDELINILDEIRSGEVSENSLEIFESCYRKKLNDKFRVTRLYTHNVDVNRINEVELDKIDKPVKNFEAFTKGPKKEIEKIFNGSLVTESLNLKEGAAVIFIKNNFEEGYINGTIGKIIEFTADDDIRGGGLPIVEIFSGRKIVVKQEDWVKENDRGEVKAFVKQIPLRLAWALTIHKSQGMTLDAAEIDLSQTFEVGQGYVALSRIRSIKGLRLMGMNDVALKVDDAVLRIDEEMRKLSALNVRKWDSFTEKQKEEMFDEFVINSDGTILTKEIENNKKRLEIEEKDKRDFLEQSAKGSRVSSGNKTGKSFGKKVRGGTLKATRNLIEQGKTLAEIAEERSISERTIQDHLSDIMERWPEIDIEYLRPNKKLIKKIAGIVEKIKKRNNEDDFTQGGDIKLRPIFEELKKKISYEDIKLAMLFID
jgi:hypothetical protein